MHTTILYHANCPDGFGSGLAAWLSYGDEAQYLPVQYGQPPPTIPAEHHVMIVDFSYDRETLLTLAAMHPSVVVLDHHRTAERALADVKAPRLKVRFDMEESGATLAWEYCNPRTEVPRFFRYLRDRDLWRWDMPHSKEVSVALWSYPRDFSVWAHIMADLESDLGLRNFVQEGRGILRYANRLVEEQAARAVYGTIGGHYVPIVNATTLFSEVGEFLNHQEPRPLFVAYYFDRADHARQWGLRGHGKVDLSIVAQGYGGGGHFDAAGFVTEQDWLGEPCA